MPLTPSQSSSPDGQIPVVELVVLDEEEDDDVDEDDDELEDEVDDDELEVEDEDNVVVAASHEVAVLNDDTPGHPPLHADPPGQQVIEVPAPHVVVPAGQPHKPLVRLMHATPVAQQLGPHGVAPAAQQHDDDGSEHD